MNNIYNTLVFLTNSTAKLLPFSSTLSKTIKQNTVINAENVDDQDSAKIAGDWRRVGNDLRKAIVAYDRKIVR